MERYNLKKLNDVEVKVKHEFKIQNTFAAFKNIDDDDDDDDDDVDINSAWESIKDNIKASATNNLLYIDLKLYKEWFDDEFSELHIISKETGKISVVAKSKPNSGS
jgi:hypothetical protein